MLLYTTGSSIFDSRKFVANCLLLIIGLLTDALNACFDRVMLLCQDQLMFNWEHVEVFCRGPIYDSFWSFSGYNNHNHKIFQKGYRAVIP